MTRTPKFLFDECLPRPVVESHIVDSLRLFGAGAEIAHLLSRFPPGTPDRDWIPQIAREGWIIVTADAGKQSKKSEKLPIICREQRVTHVILSRALHKRKAFDKCHAITGAWGDLLATPDAIPGTHFSLQLTHSHSVSLVRIWEPDGNFDGPTHQTSFLK